jgi:hypothetical protein
MLEVLAVELQLGVGRNEVLARPFVLPGEVPPAPDVSEPLAATRLLDTLLEGEELAQASCYTDGLICAFLESRIIPGRPRTPGER